MLGAPPVTAGVKATVAAPLLKAREVPTSVADTEVGVSGTSGILYSGREIELPRSTFCSGGNERDSSLLWRILIVVLFYQRIRHEQG